MLRHLLLFGISIAITAFDVPRTPSPQAAGVYGVCSCASGDNVSIRLCLNEDMTYYYADHTVSSAAVDIRGAWTQKGNVIHLVRPADAPRFPDQWRLEEKGHCITARHRLAFFRLCDIRECDN
jgi:hypothetical protein